VAEGEEARFSLELSASLPGTWFLNSTQLQQGGRYAVQQAQGQLLCHAVERIPLNHHLMRTCSE
jgi:hypothetical protein